MENTVGIQTHILFVCTGNTCRSPMAQVIAESAVNKLGSDKHAIVIDSAGVAAGDGHRASAEAVEVMDQWGIDLSGHQSEIITLELVDRADVIYAMTPAHAHALVRMVPESRAKVFPLDAMHPVLDPIGGPIEVYREVAEQLERLIQAKIKEIIS